MTFSKTIPGLFCKFLKFFRLYFIAANQLVCEGIAVETISQNDGTESVAFSSVAPSSLSEPYHRLLAIVSCYLI